MSRFQPFHHDDQPSQRYCRHFVLRSDRRQWRMHSLFVGYYFGRTRPRCIHEAIDERA